MAVERGHVRQETERSLGIPLGFGTLEEDVIRMSGGQGWRAGDGQGWLDSPGLSRRAGGRREEEGSGAGWEGCWESGCFFCRGFLGGLDDALVIG